jgi:rhamnogalacturonan endolyase
MNTRMMARRALALAVALAGCGAASSWAADIAKLPGNAPVTVTQDDRNFTLDNGIVKMVINKRTGGPVELWYKGMDLAGHDQGSVGGWETEPSRAEQVGGLTQTVTIDPAKNDGAIAEIAIKGVTGGKIGLTPGSPGGAGGGTMNMDQEVRYTMLRGESGVHVYSIFSHPKEYGPLNVPENRYILRVNQSFDWISVDKDRNMLECAPTDWGQGVVVHAKEQRIMSKGVYKNSVEHKYSYTGTQYEIPAFGWSDTKDKVGVWFINPTIEYLSGGATKTELVCHFGDNENPDPILLNYWRGTHYGGGAPANVAQDEEWVKVVGPMMIYVNSLANPKDATPEELATLKATEGNPTVPATWTENQTALWQDALAQAKKEKSAWPYDWVQGVDYPHKNERANVHGQIVLNDPQASTTKFPKLLVGLAFPDAAPGAGGGGRGAGRGAMAPETLQDGTTFAAAPAAPPAAGRGAGRGAGPGGRAGGRGFGGGGGFGRGGDWKHDSKHYQFWNDGSEDGTFTITQVRPGNYTLHAIADGVLGEFAKADIKVEAGKDLDLGKIEWKPVRDGKQIWEIGYPDHTAREFFKGDGKNFWLWGWPVRYGELFPNDVTFTIGQDKPSEKWFFEEVPHQTADKSVWANPDAKDLANQRFGWVKAFSLEEYPQTNQSGPWRLFSQGRETTWTIKFNMPAAGKGRASLRLAICGADGGGLNVGVNGQSAGHVAVAGTNALRYNTDKGVWYEYTQPFDGSLLKAGENTMTLTVPAGEVTSGVVWDYLRLELDENAAAPAAAPAPGQ